MKGPPARPVLILLAMGLWGAWVASGFHRDPPRLLHADIGVFVDEGLKTLRARNRTLFGTSRPIPGDSYEGGAGGPFSLLVHQVAFRIGGANAVSARAVSLVFALIALGVLAWSLPRSGGLLALIALAADPMFVSFSRLGLLEIPWASAVCLAILAAPRSLLVAAILLAAATATKLVALLCLPAVAIASLGGKRTPQGAFWRTLPVLAGSALLTVLVVGLPREVRLASLMAHVAETPSSALAGLRVLFEASPVLYVLGAGGLAALVGGGRYLERADRIRLLASVAWIVCGVLFLIPLGLPEAPARYVAHLVFPLTIAGALFAEILARARPVSWAVVLGVTVVAAIGVAILRLGSPAATEDLAEARVRFRRLVDAEASPAGSGVTGLWAPTLALGSATKTLVTCGGCRFPPPAGAADNLAAVLEGSTPVTTVVAAESTGELDFWLNASGRRIRQLGVIDVGPHRVVILRMR